MVTGFTDTFGSLTIPLLVIALVLYWFKRQNKNKNFPPGPMGLPIVGYLPFMGKCPPKKYVELSEKYGPIISVDIGLDKIVVLNDFDSIQEAAVKQGHIFSGRPHVHFLQQIMKGYGLIFQDYGAFWKSQRKFGMTTLRGFGVGKKSMEEKIADETSHLSNAIRAEKEKHIDCQMIITNAVSNVICNVVFGSRFEYDDRRFVGILSKMNQAVSGRNGVFLGIFIVASVTRFLPGLRSVYNEMVKDLKSLKDDLTCILDEHKETYDKNNIRDFIDAYLKEINTGGAQNSSFSEEQLCEYIIELFVAGSETTASTLRWSILCLALHPQYQEKLFNEITSVIGESGIPSMQHRDKMPYACAFIHEITRHRTMLPISVPHKVNAAVKIQSYDIPNNTTVMLNLWAVHHDPKHFRDPDEFRPERFLDSEGNFIPDSHVIPFSVGPRYCLGEQLARMELFMFFTGIVQKFRIVSDPNSEMPCLDTLSFKMLESPDAFKVSFLQR